MMSKILKSKRDILIMLTCWLLLLWIRTFIGMANGCENSVYDIINKSIFTLVFTFIWGCNLFMWDDEFGIFYKNNDLKEIEESFYDEKDCFFEDSYGSGMRNSLCVVLVLVIFCMFSFATAGWRDWIDLFSDSTYIKIGWCNINKKYIFDILMLIVFPIWTTFILRKIKESSFSIRMVFSGSIQILVLTLIGFLLYMKESNIWLVELAVVNVVTLILAVKSYIWEDIKKKGNVVALLILYGFVWILLLVTFYYDGQSIYDYMGFIDVNSMNGYFINIRKILANTSLIGQSEILTGDPYVLQFLKNSHYLLPSIWFYAGWIPALLLIVIEVVFMISTAGVIIQNQHHDGRDTMLQTIWVGLFVRMIGGLLYSFGIPLPILLPFTSDVSIFADTICVGILILSVLSNKFKSYFNLMVEEIIADWEEDDDDEEDDE